MSPGETGAMCAASEGASHGSTGASVFQRPRPRRDSAGTVNKVGTKIGVGGSQ